MNEFDDLSMKLVVHTIILAFTSHVGTSLDRNHFYFWEKPFTLIILLFKKTLKIPIQPNLKVEKEFAVYLSFFCPLVCAGFSITDKIQEN